MTLHFVFMQLQRLGACPWGPWALVGVEQVRKWRRTQRAGKCQWGENPGKSALGPCDDCTCHCSFLAARTAGLLCRTCNWNSPLHGSVWSPLLFYLVTDYLSVSQLCWSLGGVTWKQVSGKAAETGQSWAFPFPGRELSQARAFPLGLEKCWPGSVK